MKAVLVLMILMSQLVAQKFIGPPPPPPKRPIPIEVEIGIKSVMKKAYPNQYAFQKLMVESQKENYLKIKNFIWSKKIPTKVRAAIHKRLFSQYSGKHNYSVIYLLMRTEQEAYLSIN